MKRYEGEYLTNISFPIGGIGAGSIGLAGNGALIDWELFSRPNRMSINPFSGFAIKTEDESKVLDLRLLQGEVDRDLMGGMQVGNQSWGYGHGPNRGTMAGLRHFEQSVFSGGYPLAEIDFADPAFPGDVKLAAFNPFIPSNDKDSSLPCGIFDFTVKNTTEKVLTYTLAAFVTDPFTGGCVHRFEQKEELALMNIRSVQDVNSTAYGEFTISTDAKEVGYQEYWYRGSWFDNVTMYLNDFGSFGKVKNRRYDTPSTEQPDTAMLTASVTLAPGEQKTVSFRLCWYLPNVEQYWGDPKEVKPWRNYYTTWFDSAADVACYIQKNKSELTEQTMTFSAALHGSSLPEPILDAIQGNLAILKSSTCLRLPDGSFYGWEGVNRDHGSCEGSCQHVWNYAYALPYLFPKLEKSVRSYELQYSLEQNGLLHFRVAIPLGASMSNFRSCVDGQMGTVMRIYREWRLSGDTDWLKDRWERIKRCISYAWDPTNKDHWDPDKTGIITGRQHHTLDVELFGASSWLTGFYLGALEAGIAMANALGDAAAAKEYAEILQKGKAAVETLFDEKLQYYTHRVDFTDQSILDDYPDCSEYYWDTENRELKYQIADGCGIDQVLADYHTGLIGLDPIFDPEHRKAALQSIYRNNFVSMRDHDNPCRVFACNGERGVTMFSYPQGANKPKISIPYTEEFMTGFEYAAACQMLQVGMEAEAVEIVSAIRDRYDGKKRNPWAEIECGASYSRAMASYSFLPIYSGFVCDLPQKTIGFRPLREGSYFWSLDGAWGKAEYGADALEIQVLYGSLACETVIHPFETVSAVKVNGENRAFTRCGDAVKADAMLKKGDTFTVIR